MGNTIKNTMNTESNLSENLICYHDPKARASEAYRSLRTNIGFLGVDNHIKTIVVTSPDQAEGKTTTSANIAIAMAQSAKSSLENVNAKILGVVLTKMNKNSDGSYYHKYSHYYYE